MSAVLPHYKMGPANFQASVLIYGGMVVEYNAVANPTTDLTVKPAASASKFVLGVAGNDAAPIATQTGAANTYGQPIIDISVLPDYLSVYYGHTDIWTWYSGAVPQGQLVIVGATAGTVITGGVAPATDQIVGKCTHPGGVAAAMLTQQIGGQGAATFFLGRVRLTV